MKITEDGLRRLAEAARDSGMRIDEEARRLVEEGQSADFYRGYVSGIASVVTLCRCFLKTLGERVDADPHKSSETVAGELMILEVIELITMRAAAPAAVAAERYIKIGGQRVDEPEEGVPLSAEARM